MPKSTENFNLLYAVEGEVVTENIERERFQIIDSQLFGIVNVFGNGVIDGWNTLKGTGLSLVITSGSGFVDYRYLESDFNSTIFNVRPNAIQYIYARKENVDPSDILPAFFASNVLFNTDRTDRLLLAKVTTSGTQITNIDTSGRKFISFVQTAFDLVKDHRHLGGDDNPTQIDLTREVRGQLPSENIGDLDASKITSGRLAEFVIPKLNHNNLEDIGTLTHAQLDAFVRMLTFENAHLLGEVAGTNLLQIYLANKHFWSDVDEHAENLIALIPGISPDSYTDFDNTTAVINETEHIISGILAETGQVLNKTFSNNDAFKQNVNNYNMTIKDHTVFLNQDPAATTVIANFENATQANADLTNFIKEIKTINDGTKKITTDSNVNNGFFAGEIDIDEVVEISFTNTLTTAQDWSDFNFFNISISTQNIQHGQLLLTLVNGGVDNTPLILLESNEVTNGYKNLSFPLSTLNVDSVQQIVISTNTSIGWDPEEEFTFYIDDVEVVASSLFVQTGSVRYIVELPQTAQWEAVSWISTEASDSEMSVRARSASSSDNLKFTPFSNFISVSGDSPAVDDNPVMEIEFLFNSSSDKTVTPILEFFQITYIVSSSDQGYIVDSQTDWEQGVPSNKIDLDTIPGSVIIKSPIQVDDIYYGNSIILSQIDPNNIPVLGFRGNDMPPPPSKLIDNIIDNGFDNVNSVDRLPTGNFIFCDSGNDRVLELSPTGDFIYGLGSMSELSNDFSVLTSVYRKSIGQLTLVLSKRIFVDTVDLSGLTIRYNDDNIIFLGSSDTIQFGNLVDGSGTVQILKIKLSTTNRALLAGAVKINLIVNSDAFVDTLSSFFLASSNIQLGGQEVFIGEMIYVDGLLNPIDVKVTSNDTLLIGNGKVWGESNLGISSVVEMQKDGTAIFSYNENQFRFSPQTLGGVQEYNEQFFIFSGIVGEASFIIPTAVLSTTDSSGNDLSSSVLVEPDLTFTEVVHAGDVTISDFTINVNSKFQLAVTSNVEILNDDGTVADSGVAFGQEFFWSSSNNNVASVNRGGLVTATALGTVIITVTAKDDLSRTAEAKIEVSENLENPSVSTVLLTDTQQDILENAIGKTIIVDKESKNVVFTYVHQEGFYPSGLDIENEDSIPISEKSFVVSSSGRVIKIDTNGNILFDVGQGIFDSPNDVQVLKDDEIIVSS